MDRSIVVTSCATCGYRKTEHFSPERAEDELLVGEECVVCCAETEKVLVKLEDSDWFLERQAYIAYAKETGGLAHTGLPMPSFDDLPHDTKCAWSEAVGEVCRLVGADR